MEIPRVLGRVRAQFVKHRLQKDALRGQHLVIVLKYILSIDKVLYGFWNSAHLDSIGQTSDLSYPCFE